MCRILGRKLPGPEMKVLESGTRLGDEGSPGTDRLVTDSAEYSNLTGVSSLSLFLCHHKSLDGGKPRLLVPSAHGATGLVLLVLMLSVTYMVMAQVALLDGVPNKCLEFSLALESSKWSRPSGARLKQCLTFRQRVGWCSQPN
jgi:hypothetical protein